MKNICYINSSMIHTRQMVLYIVVDLKFEDSLYKFVISEFMVYHQFNKTGRNDITITLIAQ